MGCGIGPQPPLRDSRPFGVQPSVETLGLFFDCPFGTPKQRSSRADSTPLVSTKPMCCKHRLGTLRHGMVQRRRTRPRGELAKAVESVALGPGRHRDRIPRRRRIHVLPVKWRERVRELQHACAGPGYDYVGALRGGAESASDGRGTTRNSCIVKIAANDVSRIVNVSAEPEGQLLAER